MHVCTIVAGNYLPMARVLAASFLAVHPEARLSALVVDGGRVPTPRPQAEAFDVLTPQDLNLEILELHRMAMAYDVTELATALKPWLLTLLLDRGAETVTYLDPDICVYGSVQHIADLATKHGVVLTPHLLTPLPRDGLQPGEAQIMGAGAFNLGFVAVSQAARPFLRWWQERLERDAINDQSRSLFTDQRWVDLVPPLFPHHVLRDPGCNVAYWNAHSRPIARAADSWTAGGEPLRFFHFSGYRPHTPWLLSTHAPDYPRVRLPDHPALRTLCDEYGEALRSYGAADLHSDDYGWGRLPDGEPITPGQRRCYRQALLAADRGAAPYPPDPFGEAGPAAYLDWLHAPAGTDSRVSRFVHAAWSSRPDLRAAFPDPLGRSEDHLLAWLQDEGCEQLGIPSTDARAPTRAGCCRHPPPRR